MSKEKEYTVTVTMTVFGQTSKRAAADFVNEALKTDGLYPHRITLPKHMQKVKPNRCCVCGTTKNLHKDGWYGYRCDADYCVPF